MNTFGDRAYWLLRWWRKQQVLVVFTCRARLGTTSGLENGRKAGAKSSERSTLKHCLFTCVRDRFYLLARSNSTSMRRSRLRLRFRFFPAPMLHFCSTKTMGSHLTIALENGWVSR